MLVVLEDPSMGPRWNLQPAMEIHMINTHLEAGGL